MFRSCRWKIALWFVSLSSLIYLALTFVGGAYFYSSLSRSMDQQLKIVASQIGHAIDLTSQKPKFREWLRVVQTEPARSLMTMQLFDQSGILLEHYGPIGIPKLFMTESEITRGDLTMRIRSTKLLHEGHLVGYLQLELPTDTRNKLTREFLLTMAVMAPFVLIAFGLCSYAVSGMAVKPIEELVGTLQRFVADAGHELNTPTSVVQARVQSLERKLAKQGIIQKDLTIIASSAKRMGRIVSDLMLLAELDGKQNQQTLTAIDPTDVISTTVSEFYDRFYDKDIILQIGNMEQATILADRESLERIISNLLENALKYTDPNGTVTINCTTAASEVCISVQDTGLGIPRECLPQIFDRFYRVDDSRCRESGGSGLGLSIVKAITESFGGRVELDSQVGLGSTFYITLPLYKSVQIAQNLHTSVMTI
jgi:signal transduction histidine kinase